MEALGLLPFFSGCMFPASLSMFMDGRMHNHSGWRSCASYPWEGGKPSRGRRLRKGKRCSVTRVRRREEHVSRACRENTGSLTSTPREQNSDAQVFRRRVCFLHSRTPPHWLVARRFEHTLIMVVDRSWRRKKEKTSRRRRAPRSCMTWLRAI